MLYHFQVWNIVIQQFYALFSAHHYKCSRHLALSLSPLLSTRDDYTCCDRLPPRVTQRRL